MELERVGPGDVERVDQLFDRLTDYAIRVDGVPKIEDAARLFLTARPAGCDAAAKHNFIVHADDQSIGLVDLIAEYPDRATVFIGLLAIVEQHRRRGLGRAALAQVETFARESLRASTLRLAVVATNPVVGFWRKLGFEPTGETRPHAGVRVSSTSLLMEKRLRGC